MSAPVNPWIEHEQSTDVHAFLARAPSSTDADIAGRAAKGALATFTPFSASCPEFFSGTAIRTKLGGPSGKKDD
jgi:hypothetical protein